MCMLVDMANKKIYIFDELYETRAYESTISISYHGYGLCERKIRADSAEPKSIEELYQAGLKGNNHGT